jgi:hypothetical protein
VRACSAASIHVARVGSLVVLCPRSTREFLCATINIDLQVLKPERRPRNSISRCHGSVSHSRKSFEELFDRCCEAELRRLMVNHHCICQSYQIPPLTVLALQERLVLAQRGSSHPKTLGQDGPTKALTHTGKTWNQIKQQLKRPEQRL